MPTPPRTCKAPVVVEIADVILVTVNTPLKVADVAFKTLRVVVPVTPNVPDATILVD